VPEPGLLEVLPNQVPLPAAHLFEVPDQRILADRFGSQVKILDLVQLRLCGRGRDLQRL
jgi:hypothetical protein